MRTDGYGYAGYTVNPSFDSLLAKVIAYSPTPNFEDAVQRAVRALSEFRIEGVDTNIPFLHNVLRHPDFKKGAIHTQWLDEHMGLLAKTDSLQPPRRWIAGTVPPPEQGVSL